MSLFRNNQISPVNAASLSQDLSKIIHFNIEMRSNLSHGILKNILAPQVQYSTHIQHLSLFNLLSVSEILQCINPLSAHVAPWPT